VSLAPFYVMIRPATFQDSSSRPYHSLHLLIDKAEDEEK